jgi:hypothetical protein
MAGAGGKDDVVESVPVAAGFLLGVAANSSVFSLTDERGIRRRHKSLLPSGEKCRSDSEAMRG